MITSRICFLLLIIYISVRWAKVFVTFFLSHMGYSMVSPPQNTQVFPNRMKFSGFLDHVNVWLSIRLVFHISSINAFIWGSYITWFLLICENWIFVKNSLTIKILLNYRYKVLSMYIYSDCPWSWLQCTMIL